MNLTIALQPLEDHCDVKRLPRRKKREKRLREIVSNHGRLASKQENGGYTSQILLKHFKTGCLPLS